MIFSRLFRTANGSQVAVPRPAVKLTQGQRRERLERAMADCVAGQPIADVSEKYGLAPRYIHHQLSLSGLLTKWREQAHQLSAERAKENVEWKAEQLERLKRFQQEQRERDARRAEIAARDAGIKAKYLAGVTTPTLAEEYDISRERVCQILRRDNVISTVAQRNRIAREALEGEADKLRVEAKEEFEAQVAELIRLVNDGASINGAAHSVGMQSNIAHYICKKRGIKSRHRKWQDWEPKKARVRELRSEGKTYSEIRAITQQEFNWFPNAMWIARHCPELVKRRPVNKPINLEGVKPHYPVPRKQPSPPLNPDANWTDEKADVLRKHWLAGLTAQHIVDLLGGEFTRNSIISKINRMRAAGQLTQQS